MPKVPTQDNFGVMPTALPQARVQAQEMPDVAGAQNRQMGQALTSVGSEMGRIAQDMESRANQVRIDDAINQAKERVMHMTYDKDVGMVNQLGKDAFERKSKKPISEEYSEELSKSFENIAGSLGNDAQKAAFSNRTNEMLTSFGGQAMRHETEQYRNYEVSVREGTISNRTREIGLNYNNPAVIDEAVTSIKGAVYELARTGGKSAEWAEAKARNLTSNAHKVAISAALENNDVSYADAYLKKHSKDMEADDILRVRGVVTKEIDQRVGLETANEVFKSAVPKIVTSDHDRMVNITMQTESGGRRYGNDGKLLESPKGAKGEMQVMDGTKTNPGYGVKPAKDNSPEELARVGRDYLGAMVKEYAGDPAKAWAAYNAGPGNLNAAIKKAEKQGGSWVDYVPKETQNYVAKNMTALLGGDGAFQKPTLQDLHNGVRTRLGPDASPERVKFALDETTRRHKEFNTAIKDKENQAADEAWKLVASGQRVPPSLMDSMSGKDRLSVQKHWADGAPQSTNVAKWLEFTNMTPEQMSQLNPSALMRDYREHFSDADLKKANEMVLASKGLNGKGKANPEGLQLMSAADLMNRSAREMGILPESGKKTDAKQDEAFSNFQGRMQVKVNNWEGTNGKKASPEVLSEMLNEEKLNKVYLDTWGMDKEQPVLTLKPDDLDKAYVKVGEREVKLMSIPADYRASAIRRIQARGLSVSENLIASMWVADTPPSRPKQSQSSPQEPQGYAE